MAFGGLTGLGPEAIRRLMANPSGIPFGALNFHPSQMGGLMGGPALPAQFGPTEAMRLMAPSWGPGQIPMSPNSPYLPPMRGGGPAVPPMAPPGRLWNNMPDYASHFDAMGDSRQLLTNPNALPQRVPGATAETFTPRALQANVQPIQYAPGASSVYPPGPASAYPRVPNPTVNGAGSIPRGVVNSVDDAVMGMARSATESGAGLADDAVRMSAMQMPRVPTANPLAGLGPSVTPVTIASRAATSPATQTLMQRLFPTLSGLRGGGGAAGALRNFATGPGLMRGVGRGIVGGVADNLIGQPLAEQIGEVNGVAGDFASGFSTGAGYGFGFGPAGALVGGLGVGIGNTLTGGGVTDLLNPEPRSPLATSLDQVRSEEYGAQTGLSPSQQESLAQVMEKFAVNDTSVWEDLGIRSPEVQDALTEEFNRLAPDADQETRTRLLQDLATSAFMQGQTENPNSLTQQEPGMGNGGVLDPQSILALQAQAAGLMAPIAADSVAIGDMGHTALSRLAEGLPPEMAQAVMGMATGHQIEGQNSANRYMQQAYSAPQLAALGQQNAMTMQIAQQLQQQAIQSLPQFAQTGGGSIEDLLAGQALTGGGATGVDADIAAMLQAAG